MRSFKKLAGIAMGTVLAVSAFAGGHFAPFSALNAAADDVGDTEPPPAAEQSEEMAAYLFLHFVGAEGSANDEQIYFSVSKDGTSWLTLNQAQPVLKSTVGERGVRDPHIVRSPDGEKFYLIATDLSIYNRGGNWGASQTSGSQSIVIWESADLVNWSEPRLRKIARPDAGCTWAPESIWDNEKQAYMVFWASKTQDSWTHRIYRCYTTDFDTFTEPELYIESDVSWIDTTFIEHDGVYYRFTKNEDTATGLYVFMEKSTSLSGEFELVSTYTLNGKPASEMKGYEGPTVYKLNGEDKWCLLLDNYATSGGYKPFVTDDISTGVFVSGDDFIFDTTYRHGTVLPITMSEYNALVAKWPIDGETETGSLVFSLDFNNEDLTQGTGNATVTANGGTLTYGEGVNGGKAVQLSGNKYISITGANSPLKGLTTCTVSFAVKAEGHSWFFYAAPNTNGQVYRSEKYIGALYDSGTLTCERYNSSSQDRPTAATGNVTAGQWVHVTLVYRADATILYINGVRVANVSSSVNLATMLGSSPVVQLGKANWGGGEYANGWLDEFRIYNYALDVNEVENEYKAVMGVS